MAQRAGVTADDAPVTAMVGFGPAGQGFALTVDLEVAVAGSSSRRSRSWPSRRTRSAPTANVIRGNVPSTVTAVAA